MEKNVCGPDRAIRALLGAFLLLYLIRSSDDGEGDRRTTVPRILLTYAVAELSVNVFAQWCPLNALFGVDTCGDR